MADHRLVELTGRLTLPKGSFRIVEVNPGTFNGIRLPVGERWQWYALQGGGVSMRLRWGSIVTPPLEVLAAVGPSVIHVHPGRDVYVEFQAPAGGPLGQVWVVVSPTYTHLDAAREYHSEEGPHGS